eukprot:1195105-Prorocentrum_minimum.AAC.4
MSDSSESSDSDIEVIGDKHKRALECSRPCCPLCPNKPPFKDRLALEQHASTFRGRKRRRHKGLDKYFKQQSDSRSSRLGPENAHPLQPLQHAMPQNAVSPHFVGASQRFARDFSGPGVSLPAGDGRVIVENIPRVMEGFGNCDLRFQLQQQLQLSEPLEKAKICYGSSGNLGFAAVLFKNPADAHAATMRTDLVLSTSSGVFVQNQNSVATQRRSQVAIRIPLSSEQFHFNNNKRQALRQQRLEQLRQQEHSDTQQYQGAVLVLQRQISELRLQVCYVEGGCFRELCTRVTLLYWSS